MAPKEADRKDRLETITVHCLKTEMKPLSEEKRGQLNQFALKRINQYLNLRIGRESVATPFYSNTIGLYFDRIMNEAGVDPQDIANTFAIFNRNGIPYGWYRGKGTPEQLEEAAYKIAKLEELDLSNAPAEVVAEFMKSAGLGIDCSGLVYNALLSATEQLNLREAFIGSLDWLDQKEIGAEKAGVFVFAGKASFPILPAEARALDLIIIKNKKGSGFSHLALLLEERRRLIITHSVIGQIPSGVHKADFSVDYGRPKFGHQPNLTEPWEELYQKNRLGFRRLKVFQ